jgi:hypothetical protein
MRTSREKSLQTIARRGGKATERLISESTSSINFIFLPLERLFMWEVGIYLLVIPWLFRFPHGCRKPNAIDLFPPPKGGTSTNLYSFLPFFYRSRKENILGIHVKL